MRGAAPDATSSSSPRTVRPSSSSSSTVAALRPHGRRLGAEAARPRRARAARAATCSPANGSSRGEQRGPRLDQRDLASRACSRPAPSPRRPRRRRGSTSRSGHALGGGGLAVGPRLGLAQPVDRRDRSRGCRWPPPRPCAATSVSSPDLHPALAVEAAAPAHQLDAALLEPRLLPESSRSWMISSRRREHRAHVELARSPPRARPGCAAPRRAARRGAAAPSRACTRRRSTRRPPARPPRARPRARRRRDARRRPPRPAPPPRTTTSNSRSATAARLADRKSFAAQRRLSFRAADRG